METLQNEKSVLFKIVYYGPGLCGKTTNLQQIFARLKPEQKLTQSIIEIPTQTDQTLSFDFMPLSVGKIGSYTVKLSFYTVPGQVHYQASRKLILQDADGVVFVADSQPAIRQQNRQTLSEMKNYLKAQNLGEIPMVLQFNKRDLTNVMSVEEMARDLQGEREAPWFEAAAIEGIGVMETMQTIIRMTVASVQKG
jgi:signal recognition particle receptor subunit beta